MYVDQLKESIGGVIGSFVLKNGEITETDLGPNLGFVTQSILYLSEAVTETKDLKRLSIFGKNRSLSVYFHSQYILGVLITPTANLQLLNLMVRRILEAPERAEEPEEPSSAFENQIPYFDIPRDEVLPNVPKYARQVLEFVDGNRTIRDIIEQSSLSPEVVLDVIMSYRRSSVLHYKS